MKIMSEYIERYYRNKGWLKNTGHTPEYIAEQAYRTTGTFKCELCQREYQSHPYVSEARGSTGEPYLHVLCNGDMVKL